MITLPVDAKGNPDLNVQREIARKYETVSRIKEFVLRKRDEIATATVVLDTHEYAMQHFSLASLFNTVKGLSKYTKKFGNIHTGPYPVYSASSQKPLTYLDTFDYDGKYMSWSTNGFAGTILVLDGKFSINGDRGLLIPKDGHTDLDLAYMKFILEPIFRGMTKGRKGDNGEDEFTKLYPSMLNSVMIPLPVDTSGQICLEAQQEIARKYLIIEQCKQEAVSKLEALIRQKVLL